MDNINEFVLNIIAALDKQLSKAQLKNDLKGIDNSLYVKVIAKLAMSLSKKQLGNSLKQLNNLYVQVGTKFKTDKNEKNKLLNEIRQLQENIAELQLKIGVNKNTSANLVKSVISTAKTVQQYADKTSIALDIDVRKEKAINDILYIGKKYSKLFSNVAASQKYENLLSSAYSISDKSQLQDVKAQIAAFNSELRASGLAAESTGNKWKKLTERARDLFSAASIIRIAFTQVRQAVSTTINLDKVYTDLVKINDELNRNDYADYLERCNKKAQELATTQKTLIEGATEFSKSGYDLSTSDKLTEKSTILSNVGDMSASDSAKAIISGVQAYDVVDGYADVVNKADALISKYNEVGNTSAITTKEIAEGVQKVGSVFSDANTSVDEFIALLASGNRQFQDADSLALGLRTSALRIRGCTAELEAMGEETDTVVTSTAKLEEQIKALTNINGSGGVEILEADGKTFRSIYDIFLDISKVYKDMNDTDASALLELIAGKHRASAISATLNNMAEAEEILQNSLNSAGSAQKEFDAYLESTEAHITQFQAKLVETYSTFMNGDMISHAADLGTATLDLVNKTDLLKHSLIAITTLKIGQGISAIGGVIANTSKQMNILGDAIQQVKNLPLDDVLRERTLKTVGEATQSLTEKNLKLLLSQKQLSEIDRVAILERHNLTKEQAAEKLTKMGLTTATNANTAANAANAGSVTTLKGAFTGLTASVKATWAAMSTLQKASIVFAAISTAWSIGSSIVNSIKQSNEELRQATQEAANAYKETTSSIDDYVSKYQELREALIKAKGNEEETYKVKKQLLELQTELNDKFGDAYGAINLVTEAYRDQTEAIKALNKETAQTFLNENKEGIDKSAKEMTKDRHYNLSYTGLIGNTDKGEALKEIAEKYKEQGITLLDEYGDGTYLQFSIHLNTDAQSAYETINAFENDLREKAKELGNEHMFDDVLDVSSDSLNKAKETIEKYGDTYRQALTAEIVSDDDRAEIYSEALKAVEAYNDAVFKAENPYDDQNVTQAKENLDAIKNSIQDNEAEWGKYSILFDDIFGQVDTRLLEFSEALKTDSGLQELADDLEGLSDIDLQALDENIGANDSFDKLKEAAAGYKVNVDELIGALVRLGYVQGEIQGTTLNNENLISTFDQAWADSFISENDAVKELGNSLLELAEQGRLTIETFNNTDSTGYFKELGISADEAVSKINKLVDESKQLSSMSGQISSMAEALGAKLENGFVGADTLSGFDVEVRGLDSWDRFQEVLGSTTSFYEECQEAANALATEWVNSSDFLSQLTEQNEEYYKTQLEAMGIENYEEVISYAQALNEAKEVLSQSSLELGNATYDEIEALIVEGQYSELTANMILALYDAKIAEQATTIDTSADCANLIALAGDTDRTSQSIQLLIQLMDIYSGLESGAYDGNRLLREEALGEVNRIKGELEALANGENEKLEIEPTVKLGNRGKSAASKAGGEHADAYLDAFEEEYSHLKDMLDRGEISEAQYLSRLRALYTKYFKDRKEYLDEFKKYESEYLSGMLDLHNKALSGISTLLNRKISAANDAKDTSISALQEEKEAAAEAYQSQIDNIEKEKEAIDDLIKEKNKKIDSINEEIDAIERAAEARKKNIQLGEDQYILEKMLNQQTTSVYKEGIGFVFEADTSGIRDAREKVREDQETLKIDSLKNEISLIQKEIDLLDEKKDALSEEQDRIQKLMDESNKYYDNLIKQQEKMWDSMIKGMEQKKSRWEELAEVKEISEAFSYIQQVFGDLGYTVEDVLNGSDAAFEDFKAQYISLISDVNNNSDFTDGLVYATGIAKENLGSFIDKTKETAEGLDELSEKGSELDIVATSMSNASNSASALNTSTEGLNENLTGVSNAVNGISTDSADNITTLAEAFTALGEAITSVAEALGIGEEVAASGIVDALTSISGISLGDDEEGVIGQFNQLKTAVDGVTSAISGGVSEEDSDKGSSNSSSPSMGKGATDGNSGGLSGAITEMGNTAAETLGEAGGEDGEGGGVISKFNMLKTAVDNVTTAIGVGGEEGAGSEENANTLIGALRAQYEKATEVLPETKSLFEELLGVIESCVGALNSMVSAMDSMQNISMPSMGGSVSAGYNGTVGKAFADGTTGFKNLPATGYKGLPHDEKNTIRSEYGQTELTVYPNGKAEITTQPTMADLPKGTVVFNEEQTRKIINGDGNAKAVGKAYANGTDNSDGWFTASNGMELRPLQPGDKDWDMIQKVNTYLKSINNNIEKLIPNSFYEQNRQMQEVVKLINRSNITNNRNIQPSISVGDINITCPGVTSQAVMNELGAALDSKFSGLHLDAYQQSMKRR